MAIEPDDPLEHYVEVTPRALAVLNLQDCREQIERSADEPLRLAQAAKSVHLAMQAALTEALAGSDGTGAHPGKLRAEWREYLHAREGDAAAPTDDRVLSFPALLDRARAEPMPWSGRHLEVTADEKAELDRLTFLRHQIEHPRPAFHFMEPAFIARTLPVAARLTLELLRETAHRLETGELEAAERDVAAITSLCIGIERSSRSSSPKSLNSAVVEDRLTNVQLEVEGATDNPASFALPPEWYQELLVEGVDPDQPGLYEWRIEGVGVYIGQYTHTSRPRREYGRNVANILAGRAYRKGKPNEFRSIHRELAQAVREGRRITLSLIENVADRPSRNRRERELITLRRQEATQGSLPVLNAS